MAWDLSTLTPATSVPDGDFLVEVGNAAPKMVPRSVLYTALQNLAATLYAPVSHSHAISSVTGLQAVLDGFDQRLDVLEAGPPGEVLGSELWPQPAFDASSSLTINANWSIAGGVATGNGGTGFIHTSNQPLVVGSIYRCEITVTAITAGFVYTPYDGSGAATADVITTTGTFVRYMTAASTNIYLYGQGFVGTIDNVSVKQLLSGSVAPVITTNGGNAVQYVVDEGTTSIATITATNPNAGGSLVWSIGTARPDFALFQINSSTGALSWVAAPDYETPLDYIGEYGGTAYSRDNYYFVTVRCTHSPSGLFDELDVAILVQNVAEGGSAAPIITTNSGNQVEYQVNENTSSIATLAATNPNPDGVLSWSITTARPDFALFQINESTGALSWVAAPDFETPLDFQGDYNGLTYNRDNYYFVTARVTHQPSGLFDEIDVGILVLNVAEGGGATPSATTSADYTPFLDSRLPARPYQRGSVGASKVVGTGVYSYDSTSNSEVGVVGGVERKFSQRFRAQTSSPITGIRTYWVSGSVGGGYAAGNGGTIRIRIVPDNGSGLPNESGTIFSETTHSPGLVTSGSALNLPGGWNQFIGMTANQSLVAGTIYHVLYENINGSPAANFISVNSGQCYGDNYPYSPVYSNADWVSLRKVGAAWTVVANSNSTLFPVLQLASSAGSYGSGLYAASNYEESGLVYTFPRANATPWRTRIIPASTRVWYGGAIAANVIVPGTCNWTLKTSGGTTMASGSWSHGSVNDGRTASDNRAFKQQLWFPMHFGASGVSLTSGATYYLEYVPAGAAQFRVFVQADGRGALFPAGVTHTEVLAQHWHSGAYIGSHASNFTKDQDLPTGGWREFFVTA